MKRHVYYTLRNGGRWRIARVKHRCDWGVVRERCGHRINVGDEYYDTREQNPSSSSPYGTYRICAECARQEIDI